MTGRTDAPDPTPTPPGVVSTIRGRYQGPVLRWLTRVLVVLGVLGTVVDGDAGRAIATVAVVAVVAAPPVRVAWLVFRWYQEQDTRFVLAGLGVLAVVGAGIALAAAGVGS